MTRELVGLEVDLASVDMNSSYAVCSKSRKKSQLPVASKDNNLPSTQACNDTHIH